MAQITGFTSDAARARNIASGRISATVANALPVGTPTIPNSLSPRPGDLYSMTTGKPLTQINAGDLGGTTTNFPTIPTPQPTTNNLAIASNNAFGQASVDASYTPPANPAKDQLNTYLEGILNNAQNESTQINDIYKQENLAAKKQKATALATEADQMDKAYRDEVNRIKQNSEGKFGGAIQADINQATDRYQNNRANLALTYKVANEDYQGAQDIVNQKVAALKDQHAQEIQAYQLLADSVNNDLTKSEQLQMQSQLALKENQAKTIQTAYSNVLALAVQNKAPASVLSAIDTAAKAPNATESDIYSAAGQYAIDPNVALDQQYKKAQIANIYSTIADRNNQSNGVSGVLTTTNGQTTLSPYAQTIYDSVKNRTVKFTDLKADEQKIALAAFSAKGETLPRSLNAAQQQAAQNAESGLGAIQTIENQLFPNGIGGDMNRQPLNIIGFSPFGIGARTLKTSIAEASDVITRIRTGAALNAEEQKFYQDQLPNWKDDTSTVRYKLNQLKGLYAGIAGSPVTISNGTDGYVISDLYTQEARKTLRDAIQHGYNITNY